MGRPVAFALIENEVGRVLLIQRAYGSKKYRWSLPGGFCDKDSFARAAAREAREETGLHVKVLSTVLIGRNHRIRTFFAKPTGGRLRPQRGECLAARFFSYDALPKLAFSADRRAISQWLAMKQAHTDAQSKPSPRCPHCGTSRTRLRRYPHLQRFRCKMCEQVFDVDSQDSTPPPVGAMNSKSEA